MYNRVVKLFSDGIGFRGVCSSQRAAAARGEGEAEMGSRSAGKERPRIELITKFSFIAETGNSGSYFTGCGIRRDHKSVGASST